jgi:hypothetical protein
MLANLMLLNRLDQPLPLLFILVLRIQSLHIHGVVHGRRRVVQLHLAIMVAHYDIVL